jgi:hypothetical protein
MLCIKWQHDYQNSQKQKQNLGFPFLQMHSIPQITHFAIWQMGADDVRHRIPREVVDKPPTIIQHNLLQLLARGHGEAVYEDGDASEDAAGNLRGGRGGVSLELRGELAVLRGHVAPEVGEGGGGEGAARVFGGGGFGAVGRRRGVVSPRPLLAGRGGGGRRRRAAATGGGGAHGGRACEAR